MPASWASGVRRQVVARLGDEAADAIDEFLALALAHEGTHAPSLETFLDWFEKGASDVKRDMDQAGGAVRVMTVHGAKGLEAPTSSSCPTPRRSRNRTSAPALLYTDDCVFFNVKKSLEVPAITDAKAAAHEREMEEYRRLLYVALTRARDWLIVAGYEMKKFKVHPLSWYQAIRNAAEQLNATGRGRNARAGRSGRRRQVRTVHCRRNRGPARIPRTGPRRRNRRGRASCGRRMPRARRNRRSSRRSPTAASVFAAGC